MPRYYYYQVELKYDDGIYHIQVIATTALSAMKEVMRSEKCPASAVIMVKRSGKVF